MPRLVRFYGGAPMDWLQHTPAVVVSACLTMLPTLEAEEGISHVNRTALGTGHVKEDVAKALMQSMERSARANRPVVQTPPADPAVALAQLGIPVRRIKRKKKATT